MLQGQILPVQMSLSQLKSVQDGSRNLPLKFGQNLVSNSWDIADITTFMGGRVAGWVGCLKMEIGLSQPQLKLKLSWVELRLSLAKSFKTFQPYSICLFFLKLKNFWTMLCLERLKLFIILNSFKNFKDKKESWRSLEEALSYPQRSLDLALKKFLF